MKTNRYHLGCVGYRVLEIIEIVREKLLDNANPASGHLQYGLKESGRRYPLVRNARGLGLMLAISLDGKRMTPRLVERFKT